jgi:ADP-ribose pyrophosphatase
MKAEDDELLVQGRRFDVVRRNVVGPSGQTEAREVVLHPGSVLILPMLDEDNLLLIRNRRYTLGKMLWELPAGTRSPGEDPSVCAARELEEETGHRATTLTWLFELYPAPGITDERMVVYLATGLVETAQKLDPVEDIAVHPSTVEAAIDAIARGEIDDGKTIAALLYYRVFGAQPVRPEST